MESKLNNKNMKYNNLIKHPYFGFIILALVLAFAQVLNLLMPQVVGISLMRALGTTIVYTIVALGFSLLLGYAGLASLGTAGFMGLGAYMTGYFVKDLGVPYIITFIAVLIVSVIIGVLVGFISLRIVGMYLAIITLGLSEILVELFKNLDKFTGGVSGKRISSYPKLFMFLQLDRETTFFLLVLVLLVIMILTLNIINSPTGRAMLAMKNSESAAQSMGISLLKYRLLAFVLATAYAVVGGILLISYTKYSEPTTWSLALSLNILAAVIVGGTKSIWGVFAGSLIIFGFDLMVIQNIAFFNKFPGSSMIFNGILIIVIVMFYPGGLSKLFLDIKRQIHKFNDKRSELKHGKE